MTLEIHIVGPGLDTTRLVHAAATELILGRDIECNINLPDPERNVSRRHLAVWNEGGVLHFRVLSSVNGVDMPFGFAPPGAKGVLPVGQMLKLGDYTMEVRAADAGGADQDPWDVLDRGNASDATLPRGALVSGGQAQDPPTAVSPEEDPFGDWGFDSTFGPGSAGASPRPGGQGATNGDFAAYFCKGLGLDTTRLAALSGPEMEAAGRSVRVALEGLFELYASRAGKSGEAAPAGQGVVPVKDNNPLKTDWPEQTKLQYLFGGRAASMGFVSPQKALTDLVTELLAHDAAAGAATRAVVEATLQEFAPAALKARLLGSGNKLFEGARAWEAYSRYHAEQSREMAGWVEQLLDQHFAEAYLRESQRIKRETGLDFS